jgi:hypothetical protein
VHVVKPRSKAAGVGDAGPRSKAAVVGRKRAGGGCVLFVDDDMNELVQADIAAAEHVHRVHFSRGS